MYAKKDIRVGSTTPVRPGMAGVHGRGLSTGRRAVEAAEHPRDRGGRPRLRRPRLLRLPGRADAGPGSDGPRRDPVHEGVIAPIPGITRLFWGVSSRNP